MGNITYKDGDPPVSTYNNLIGPGWAYYASSSRGPCQKCGNATSYWLVSIKELGHHVCSQCKATQHSSH